MARAVGLDGLADAVSAILEEYQTEVERGTKECVRKGARAGVRALQETSPQRTGRYAAGWTSEVTEGRLNTTARIYNGRKPGLVHLLEHGHVLRNGTGRTFGGAPAIVHVAPVEERICSVFEKEIEAVIT